jgi:hypothetical protein
VGLSESAFRSSPPGLRIVSIVAIPAIGNSLTDSNDGVALKDVQLCSTDGARVRTPQMRKGLNRSPR